MNVELEECSPFAITRFSNNSGTYLSSTIVATVVSGDVLDGTNIECFAGGHSKSLQVGNVSVNVVGMRKRVSHNAFHLVIVCN